MHFPHKCNSSWIQFQFFFHKSKLFKRFSGTSEECKPVCPWALIRLPFWPSDWDDTGANTVAVQSLTRTEWSLLVARSRYIIMLWWNIAVLVILWWQCESGRECVIWRFCGCYVPGRYDHRVWEYKQSKHRTRRTSGVYLCAALIFIGGSIFYCCVSKWQIKRKKFSTKITKIIWKWGRKNCTTSAHTHTPRFELARSDDMRKTIQDS